MTDIVSLRRQIQLEGAQFRSAVSEALAQEIGGAINFINTKQHSEKQFFANGRYARVAAPQTAVDGSIFFEFNATIINVWAFNQVPGSGGTTELDVKRITTPGGSRTSIFSTTPKFTSASAANSWVDALGKQAPGTGVTAPVLSLTDVNEGDSLEFDFITKMTGSPENCGLVVHYRPR